MNGSVYVASTLGLYRSDGTPAGTTLVAAMTVQALRAVDQTLFFVAGTPLTGAELWKSDGTGPGTVLVKDIAEGSPSSLLLRNQGLPGRRFPMPAIAVNGTLFFAPNDRVHGVELWKTDGSDAGTVLVKDIAPGPASSFPAEFA